MIIGIVVLNGEVIAISMNKVQDAIQTIVDGANNIIAIPNDGLPIPNPLNPPDVGQLVRHH